jgi:hypothetical protein
MLLALSADQVTHWPTAAGAWFVASLALAGFAIGFALPERPLEKILRILYWLN